MSEIDPYVQVLFLRTQEALQIPKGYARRYELIPPLKDQVAKLLGEHDGEGLVDVEQLANWLFNQFIEGGAISETNERFAGKYYISVLNKYEQYRTKALTDNVINASAERIGPRYFRDVFAGFREAFGEKSDEFPSLGIARASDRIITFSDNQVSELDDKSSELIAAVSAQNQIDGNPGLRELLLGQLRAGRELVRAGTVRLYILQITLIETLQFLAKRYEKEAIGGLAAALLTALLKHMGLDS